ncbi:MAG: DUF3015 family protein [Deltaproteobacteria bacterium]|nr:DUF3015 family protein [Deltaproteobacteria bacterium]
MKELLVFLAFAALVSVNEASALPRNNGDQDPDSDGCGAGWQVTRRKTFFGTSTRGTTNLVIPPTFAMTSGTSGCSQHPIAKKDEAALRFAFSNYDALLIDMAGGGGETLDAFARLLSCGDAGNFGRAVQRNFKSLVPPQAAPFELFENVKQLIDDRARLATGCNV